MRNLPTVMVQVLVPFSCPCSLTASGGISGTALAGTILAPDKRTVTVALRVMGIYVAMSRLTVGRLACD